MTMPNDRAQTPGDRAWFAGIFCVGAVALVFHAAMYSWWAFDDAFISMRYAENLVRHGALEYNLGERVEGYSNLLWTLQLALADRLGLPMFPVARTLGLLANLGILLLGVYHALRFARTASPSRIARDVSACVVVLGLACAGPLAGHAQTGMETTQHALLLDVAFLGGALAGRERRGWTVGAGCAMALAVFSRPEAFGYLPFFWLSLVLPESARRRLAGPSAAGISPRWFVLGAALPLLALAALLAWRISYYGSPLPLTVTAKSVADAGLGGLRYIQLFFTYGPTGGVWVVLAPAVVAALCWRLPGRSENSDLCRGVPSRLLPTVLWLAGPALLLFANCLFVIKVGGDILTFSRFMVPSILPVALILAYAAMRLTLVAGAVASPPAKAGCALYLVLVLTLYAGQATNLFHSVEYHSRQVMTTAKAPRFIAWALKALHKGEIVTRSPYYNPYSGLLVPLIQDHWMPGQSAVLGDIGMAGALAKEVRIIDANGLVTPVFARLQAERDNRAYRRQALEFLTARRPEWLVLVQRAGAIELVPGLPLSEWEEASAYETLLVYRDWGERLIEPAPVREVVVLRRRGLAPPDTKARRQNYRRLAEVFPNSAAAAAIARNAARNADLEIPHHVLEVGETAPENRIQIEGRTLVGTQMLGEFAGGGRDGWSFTGDAMTDQPFRAGAAARPTQGYVGEWLIDTSQGGPTRTAPTGRARSPEFVPRAGDYLGFRVAGAVAESSGVRLEVNGELAAHWQGVNSALLRSVLVDLTPWAGLPVRIVVEDMETRDWGWVMADHFVVYRSE
ncbi:MAG TPA: hypothetical protein PLS90_08320 [Candidatus Sumerlaeota bacterium]|nr:hypothetical protein [Candidatus Sumerlaeota bacterium]